MDVHPHNKLYHKLKGLKFKNKKIVASVLKIVHHKKIKKSCPLCGRKSMFKMSATAPPPKL